MAANDKDLKKAKGGLPAPQYYNPAIDDYDYATGRDGAADMYPVGSKLLKTGHVTVSTPGTAVQFPAIACREVTIIGLDTNTGPVFVGDAGVSPTSYGVKLNKDGSITLPVQNTNMVYLDAAVAGEGVSYVAL